MKLHELHEGLFNSKDDDMTVKSWYIVRDADDAIAGGPYDSKKEAVADSKYKQWYVKSPNEYYIEFGLIDPTFDGGYDKFKQDGV